MKTFVDVALILWNEDVIQLVSFVLLNWNLKSAGVEPSGTVEEIEQLIISSRPLVVMFDLAPPYKHSTAIMLRLVRRFHDCSFILTCADPILVLKTAPWLAGYPIFQKPYELNEIASTIQSITTLASTVTASFR